MDLLSECANAFRDVTSSSGTTRSRKTRTTIQTNAIRLPIAHLISTTSSLTTRCLIAISVTSSTSSHSSKWVGDLKVTSECRDERLSRSRLAVFARRRTATRRERTMSISRLTGAFSGRSDSTSASRSFQSSRCSILSTTLTTSTHS